MKSHAILTDEELKMLLSKEEPDPLIIDKPQSNPTLLPRSAKHGKKKNIWKIFSRKK